MRIRFWYNLSIRQKLLLFCLIIVAGTMLISYTVYKTNQKLFDSEKWVDHTEEVIYKSENIRSLSKDIETSGKGFVITNDSEFLQPLHNAKKNIFTDISLLKKLSQDNFSQQKRIDSLSSYIINLLQFSSDLIKIRSKDGLTAAANYSSAKQGKHYSDTIKNIINSIQQEENSLLKKRKQNNEKSIMVFNRLSLAAFIFRLVFIIILIIAAAKYLQQSEVKEKQKAELIIAYKNLALQNEEKEKHKAGLISANEQLSFQNHENEKHAAEIYRIKTDKEALINAIDDLIWSVDDKLCIITANNAYMDMMKIITGKIPAEGDLVLLKEFGKELNNTWAAYYNRALNNERFTIRERIYNPKKQSMDIGLISFNPMFNQQQKVYGVACYSKDITEETLTFFALQEAKEELNKIMNSSPDMICTFDDKGKFKKINAAAERILGYTPDELIGTAYLSLVYLSDRERTNNAALEVLTGVHMTNFENSCVHKDGSLVPFTWSVSWNENDKVVYGVGKDATQKKKDEKQIRESEKRFRQIVETAQEGIWMIDNNNQTTFVNKKMCEILEYTEEEMMGKSNLFFKDAAEQKNALEQIERRRRGLKETHESKFITKSGRNIWTQVSTNPIMDDDGKYIGALAMITDITEKKLAEEKVEQEKIIKRMEITNAVIAAQESERSEIGREMHDNINQLLSASRLYIDTARKDELNREALLNNASRFSLSAIEEIRKLSKALISPSLKEAGLTDSIKDLAKEIMHVHPVKILFNTNNFKEDNYTEKFIINIFRIVQEQVNNIIKHAKAKQIDIKIEEKSNDLSIAIIDDGIGFDTAKKSGGIGINNIKSRGELYNGIVALTSQPGKGTSLYITFNKKELVSHS